MKKSILLLPFLLTLLIGQAQQVLSSKWVSKLSVPKDSLRMTVESQNALVSSRDLARSEAKNILIFPPGERKRREVKALYLGELEKKEVYKVNSAAITSKYAAEVEKNLELLFESASDKGWILFFDEADQLFSRSEQPQSTASYIQKLAQTKNVTTIFWCEDDCLTWLKNSRYVLLK